MKKIIFSLVIFCVVENNFAQGCSDAGICSIGSSFDEDDEKLKNNIDSGVIFGAGEADLTYISPYVSYTRKWNDRLSISSKITYSSANGSFGTRSSFGDGYVIANYTFKEKAKKQWSTLVGWKFPFTNANLKIDGASLPLDYQSSLGTFDLFLGSNLKYLKWNFNAALQIPVFNNNKNSYFAEFSGTDDFSSTNLFERKPDALIRATYTLKSIRKFTFKPNVLFIYHLGEDSFENILGVRETIVGSDGLTINGSLITSYNINKKNSIELTLASPFVIRDVRPDGLTRSFTLSLNYQIQF